MSPCWFELSDCPDCSGKDKERERENGLLRQSLPRLKTLIRNSLKPEADLHLS